MALKTPQCRYAMAARPRRRNNAPIPAKESSERADQSQWRAEKIGYIARQLIYLTGLITYERAFTDKKVSDITEAVIAWSLAAITAGQWLLLMRTSIVEWSKDPYSAILVLPYVLIGPVLVVKVCATCQHHKNSDNTSLMFLYLGTTLLLLEERFSTIHKRNEQYVERRGGSWSA